EYVLVRGDRAGLVLDELLVEAGHAVKQHEPYAGIIGELAAPLDHLDQLLDAAFQREQAVECRERDRIVAAALVHLAPRIDRGLAIAALALVDLRGLRPQGRRELAIGGCRAVLDRARRLVPRAELAGEREQLL